MNGRIFNFSCKVCHQLWNDLAHLPLDDVLADALRHSLSNIDRQATFGQVELLEASGLQAEIRSRLCPAQPQRMFSRGHALALCPCDIQNSL